MIEHHVVQEHQFPLSRSGDIVEYHEFVITGDDYDILNDEASNRWSTVKGGDDPTKYDSGVINTEDDPHRAERHGIAAEFSHGLYFDRVEEVLEQSGYREGGDDGYDDDDGAETTDVKCTSMSRDFWITVEDKGYTHPIEADWYEGAKVIEDSPKEKRMRIRLLGRISKEDVEAKPTERSPYGHYVKKIPFRELEPLPTRSGEEMSEYIDEHKG